MVFKAEALLPTNFNQNIGIYFFFENFHHLLITEYLEYNILFQPGKLLEKFYETLQPQRTCNFNK